MIKTMLLAAAALSLTAAAQAQPAGKAKVTLTRLDCGSIAVSNLDVFSDSYLYAGQSKTLTDSCYLVRHGDKIMIWDTGLSADLVGQPAQAGGPFTMSMKQTLVAQLAQVGVKPGDVSVVGISHYHDDHTGQAAAFPGATLIMGKGDFDAAKQRPSAQKALAPWISGTSKVDAIAGDKDVFGDGRVMVLAMPGHTPGHQALLVRLSSGAILLTGDQFHFAEQVANNGVPSFNTNRADTLASSDRFQAIAKNLRAKVIIQHETKDIGKLPAFPKAAE